MTTRLLNSQGDPVTIIGGSTAYITVAPGVPGVTAEGTKVTIPVPRDIAIWATRIKIQQNGEIRPAQTLAGLSPSSVVVRIDQGDTVNEYGRDMVALLEMTADLTADLPMTLYKAGDRLAFRWSFLLSPSVGE